jgi:hypothetical protein
MPTANTLELHKQPGLHYALGPDGVELPIVDVTHPAFALTVNGAEQRALIAEFMKDNEPLAKLPGFARKLLLKLVLRGSRLAEAVQRAQGTFMSAMDTYLFKLGPDNLPSPYRKPIDRRIAAALPSLAMRLRLQDTARMLADALTPALLADPQRPLHLLNIAGGSAIDSLNALLILQHEHADLLAARPIAIQILDMDAAAPAFGERALRALSAEGAPLHGLQIRAQHVPYDWSNVAGLEGVLAQSRAVHAISVGSSEGGLFEYGSDDAIVDNLEMLRKNGPPGFVMVGSVTRADDPIKRLHLSGRPATRPRGLSLFRALVARAGWRVTKAIERPFSDHVMLTPSAADSH